MIDIYLCPSVRHIVTCYLSYYFAWKFAILQGLYSQIVQDLSTCTGCSSSCCNHCCKFGMIPKKACRNTHIVFNPNFFSIWKPDLDTVILYPLICRH